jgi:DNA-binding CsgD family transcriptional regulator
VDAASRRDATRSGETDRRKGMDSAACAALRFLSDQLGYAVLVSSRDSRLLHANTAGWSLLSADSPFSLIRGQLVVAGTPCVQWYATMPGESARARCTVVMHRSARGRQSSAFRVAVRPGALQRADDPLVFCVYGELSQRQVDADVLRALYDLTPAEAATAMGLFSGSSLAQIARARSASIHTVRTQLKRVLLKCRVRSQLQLCRLLASGPGVF